MLCPYCGVWLSQRSRQQCCFCRLCMVVDGVFYRRVDADADVVRVKNLVSDAPMITWRPVARFVDGSDVPTCLWPLQFVSAKNLVSDEPTDK